MASGNRLGDRLMSKSGPNPVIAVMSATRPPFLRKQTFVPDLAMSRKCQLQTFRAPFEFRSASRQISPPGTLNR